MEMTDLQGYDLLYHGAGFAAVTGEAVLRLQGKDTVDFLHRLSTNAVSSLQQGAVLPTIFTNDKGRIIDYVHLVHTADAVYMFGSKGRNEMLLRWLNRYIITDDVTVTDMTGTMTRYEVLGPNTPGIIYLAFGTDTHSIAAGSVVATDPENGNYFVYKVSQPNHISLYVFGETEALKTVLNEQCTASNVFQAGIVDELAYELYRIENGLPTTAEVNDAYNPHETEMLHAVSFKKGCYIGQEVIARLDTYDKVQKKLRLLKVGGTVLPEPGCKLTDHSGEDAGLITSAVVSPRHKSIVALGFVKKVFAAEGTHLKALCSPGEVPVLVKNNLH